MKRERIELEMKLIDLDATDSYLLDGRYIVDPPKHGHWIISERNGVLCSECGQASVEWMPVPFCSHCGAKMENL